ncbi:MAG: hypothetical protein K8J31_29390, partial [Anaerolineae bacterium]|nr:hypothetical protein [Anaerolineae bacterium]
IINEGDYTLNVQSLKFVRGVDDNVDDFSGDRIPRDILPPDRNCFQIILGNGTPTIPAQCSPISEHRQGQETLVDPRRVPWRSEAEGTARIKSFEVWYQGKMITRCDTVERGGNDECRFNWPELPPSGE